MCDELCGPRAGWSLRAETNRIQKNKTKQLCIVETEEGDAGFLWENGILNHCYTDRMTLERDPSSDRCINI